MNWWERFQAATGAKGMKDAFYDMLGDEGNRIYNVIGCPWSEAHERAYENILYHWQHSASEPLDPVRVILTHNRACAWAILASRLTNTI